MALQYLNAEKQPTQYFFRVHMDDTKLVEGSPDPIYVREYSWSIIPPDGQTEQEYLDTIKREIGLLIEDEIARMNAPAPASTPLAGF